MKKHSFEAVPKGYIPARSVDLVHNKKEMWGVSIASVVLMVLLAVPAVWVHPLHFTEGTGRSLLYTGVTLAALILYIILHELVHGIAIYLFGGKPYFGFKGGYAFAGTKAVFPRAEYITIALAPVVLWGIVLAILCAALPEKWFWPCYFVQLVNLSGAAGDYYVTLLALRLPPDILVKDDGTAMTFFARA